MCYDAFHSVHNSNSSKSQAYLALAAGRASQFSRRQGDILETRQMT